LPEGQSEEYFAYTTGIDEEAAAYAIPQGMFAAYQNLHKIYTDSANADRNRKFLRYRAHNVLKGDEVTKEMCHRYLMSVRDEEYLKEVQ
jgi:kynurenine formamidase